MATKPPTSPVHDGYPHTNLRRFPWCSARLLRLLRARAVGFPSAHQPQGVQSGQRILSGMIYIWLDYIFSCNVYRLYFTFCCVYIYIHIMQVTPKKIAIWFLNILEWIYFSVVLGDDYDCIYIFAQESSWFDVTCIFEVYFDKYYTKYNCKRYTYVHIYIYIETYCSLHHLLHCIVSDCLVSYSAFISSSLINYI